MNNNKQLKFRGIILNPETQLPNLLFKNITEAKKFGESASEEEIDNLRGLLPLYRNVIEFVVDNPGRKPTDQELNIASICSTNNEMIISLLSKRDVRPCQ